MSTDPKDLIAPDVLAATLAAEAARKAALSAPSEHDHDVPPADEIEADA